MAIAASLLPAPAAWGVVIDDFSSGAFAYTATSPYAPSAAFVQQGADFAGGGTPPLGSLRTFDRLAASGGVGSSSTYAVNTLDGLFRIDSVDTQDRNTYKYFDLTYGSPDSPLGVDLTAGGADRLRLRFVGEAPGIGLDVRVVGMVEGQTWSLSTSIGDIFAVGPAESIVDLPYSEFSGNLAALQDVVTMSFSSSRLQADTAIDLIETATALLTGDFNRDGVVTLQDHAFWSDSYAGVRAIRVDGSLYVPTSSRLDETTVDANRDGAINAADYTVWRDAYATATAQATAAPEPTALLTCGMAMLLAAAGRCPAPRRA
ncbi:hypothetical protein Pla108_33130 [Botrimarina colliarenosi]|uniref:Dockerin domain-containing protein n=2 Tax=Botrimarina colliarenosi TaxID=2528001 RepID=A0A5C6A814_9BACT|nr:hypothetical protein Pla108_33130 [Botrimarina colliarenosi]